MVNANIELATKYLPYVDEVFTQASKKEILTSKDFSIGGEATNGAHYVKIYKIATADMNDYGRRGPSEGNWSRYGALDSLDATTEEFKIEKDRSFTFVIDTLDEDETGHQLNGAEALNRQIRQVVIPEVDTYTYGVMCDKAGTKPEAVELTADNIYDEIIKASTVLDDALVPETGRILTVTPEVYQLMKKSKDIVMETEVGSDMRIKGVIGNLDGMQVIRIAAARLPENFGFMLVHPCATVAPTKLKSYRTHLNPPGIDGILVEGRIVYDAFVLENKAKAIYYQERI